MLVLSGTSARSPASILDVLCRKWYPGLVNVSEDVREPAYNWDRYALVTDDTATSWSGYWRRFG